MTLVTIFGIFLQIVLFQVPGETFEDHLAMFVGYIDQDLDSAAYYAHNMLDVAQEMEDDALIVRAEYALGYTYRQLDNYGEAIIHYQNSWFLARSHQWDEREVMASNGLGTALYELGDYPEALRYLYISLEKRKERKIPEELSTVYNNIGLVYMKMFNWEKAHEFFSLALVQHEQSGLEVAPILVNMGVCLPRIGRYAEASAHLTEFREICESSECNPELWCDYYNAQGGIYLTQDQMTGALIYFEKALEVARANGYTGQLEKAYDNLSNAELGLGHYQRAAQFSDSALFLSRKLGLTRRQEANYLQLARVYDAWNKPNKSLYFWNSFDSLYRGQNGYSDVLNEVYTLAMNTQAQSFDDRLIAQETTLSSARRNAYILMVLLGIVLFTGVMWWFNHWKKQKAQKELSTIQEAMFHRQKMAALGSLMAGIAHEINSPLATAGASLQASRNYYSGLTDELEGSKSYYHIFSSLRSQLEETDVVLEGRARRSTRRSLEAEMETMAISDPERFSELLLECGVTELNDELREILSSEQNEFWLNKLHNYLALKRSNTTALNAVSRIREIIESLRQQVQEPEHYFVEEFDLAENVRSVLLLLQNQLKYDVEVTLDLPAELLMVHGNASRIGQVWTNLIVNALQAMQGEVRHLTIQAEKWTGAFVRVIIRDSGHGISRADQAYVFENSFSTRHHDTGLGLGLYLSRKIVEEHQGKLSFISGAGYTEMHVFLPV